MKKIILIVAIIFVAVLVAGYKLDMGKFGSLNMASKEKAEKLTPEESKAREEAKTKALDFIDKNLVQPGTEVKVKSIEEENGMYKFELDVSGQNITAYMTKDGKKFFPSVMDIEETEKKAADAKTAEEEAEKNIAKSDKPKVDLYVMSFCPYGNKAEDTLKPAYELLKNKVDFNFHYIVNSEGDSIQSLHGQPEVVQNEREACVMKNYGKDKWVEFATYVNANCGSDGACWEAGAKELAIDTAKITSCVASEGTALMKADEKSSGDAKATGSPTMLINGSSTKAVYKYGNAEAYKQAICNAFNEVPEECSTVLDAETATAEGGSCN
ncbi:MAG: hypothetical protein A2288_00520 [Candidatus Moranbacteria bacterium RIFOXYA12_FULL_44_15]|nr:MAG: hypothetical protein A2288_00520 [Candidatus Moranbacteria bacterium RIFOXYA12_FULL_44_15]OGI34556.1 MAG: hypothetical protein A2259_05145 [Candidatus Moranbacteria bacterium RIFOXYA2_FULL_43_15]